MSAFEGLPKNSHLVDNGAFSEQYSTKKYLDLTTNSTNI
jgi:hypothetical protein